MSKEISLSAVQRSTLGKNAAEIRRRGFVPAILYGHGLPNVPLAIEAKGFLKLLPELSSSTLLDLNIQGAEPRRVLIQEVQRDPLTGLPIHVDFHQVKLTEKIRAHVPLRATGTSSAVKDQGGILVQSIGDLEVEALPQDLPSEILVDLAKLATFEDRITVADLPIPPNVEVKTKPEEVVAVVTPPRTEEELKELEAAAEVKVAEVKTEAEEKKAAEEAKQAEEGAPAAEKKPGEKQGEKKAEKPKDVKK